MATISNKSGGVKDIYIANTKDLYRNHKKIIMKITLEEKTKREIEVEFPLSWKWGERTFIHCYDKDHCIIVHFDNFAVYSFVKTVIAEYEYAPEKACSKQEVEAAFNRVVREARNKFFPVSLDDNLPTEVLEQMGGEGC